MPDNSRGGPILAVAVVVGFACYAGYRLHEALTPFILAAAFAYILNPVVCYFEARGMRRIHLVCTGYLIAILIGWALYAVMKVFMINEATRLTANLPIFIKNVQKLALVVQARLTQSLPLPAAISSKALESIISTALERLQDLPSQAFGLVPLFLHGLLVPFIGFFFLLDARENMDQFIQTTPSRFVEQAIHLIGEIDISLGGYLRGMLITAGAIATVSFFGLVILEIDNALAISALSGLCSVVPYMGAVAGIVIGGALAWYQLGTAWGFVKVALFFLGVRVADEIFLQPVIAKRSVHLHPMVNLLVLVIGAEMFGFMGLVFAVPAACIIKSLIKVGWSWYASESGFELPPGAATEGVPYT